MSLPKLCRQSLQLVLRKGHDMYSLTRMDISGLFYPSSAKAESAAKKKKKNVINKLGVVGSMGRLPRTRIHYQPFRSSVVPDPYGWVDAFALFGEDKNKILCSDPAGHASIYDTELHSFLGMPPLHSQKGPNYMAVSIPRTAAHAMYDYEVHPEVDSDVFADEHLGDLKNSLYMMDMCPTKECPFEVLAYYPVGKWRWRPLPSPPFFDDKGYKPPDEIPFAVVDGNKICISSSNATYSFDTVTLKWIKVGDWVMPFKSEYIAELGLYLGLSDQSPYELCTLDLSAALKSPCNTMPPTVRHVFQDLEKPENWCLLDHFLVNLGSGRLCIAKVFDITNYEDECDFNPVIVFTGVEVLPCDVHWLRVIKHKSKCILTDEVEHVL
ncbi:unnamed protein product [Urochloa humidicola]